MDPVIEEFLQIKKNDFCMYIFSSFPLFWGNIALLKRKPETTTPTLFPCNHCNEVAVRPFFTVNDKK